MKDTILKITGNPMEILDSLLMLINKDAAQSQIIEDILSLLKNISITEKEKNNITNEINPILENYLTGESDYNPTLNKINNILLPHLIFQEIEPFLSEEETKNKQSIFGEIKTKTESFLSEKDKSFHLNSKIIKQILDRFTILPEKKEAILKTLVKPKEINKILQSSIIDDIHHIYLSKSLTNNNNKNSTQTIFSDLPRTTFYKDNTTLDQESYKDHWLALTQKEQNYSQGDIESSGTIATLKTPFFKEDAIKNEFTPEETRIAYAKKDNSQKINCSGLYLYSIPQDPQSFLFFITQNTDSAEIKDKKITFYTHSKKIIEILERRKKEIDQITKDSNRISLIKKENFYNNLSNTLDKKHTLYASGPNILIKHFFNTDGTVNTQNIENFKIQKQNLINIYNNEDNENSIASLESDQVSNNTYESDDSNQDQSIREQKTTHSMPIPINILNKEDIFTDMTFRYAKDQLKISETKSDTPHLIEKEDHFTYKDFVLHASQFIDFLDSEVYQSRINTKEVDKKICDDYIELSQLLKKEIIQINRESRTLDENSDDPTIKESMALIKELKNKKECMERKRNPLKINKEDTANPYQSYIQATHKYLHYLIERTSQVTLRTQKEPTKHREKEDYQPLDQMRKSLEDASQSVHQDIVTSIKKELEHTDREYEKSVLTSNREGVFDALKSYIKIRQDLKELESLLPLTVRLNNKNQTQITLNDLSVSELDEKLKLDLLTRNKSEEISNDKLEAYKKELEENKQSLEEAPKALEDAKLAYLEITEHLPAYSNQCINIDDVYQPSKMIKRYLEKHVEINDKFKRISDSLIKKEKTPFFLLRFLMRLKKIFSNALFSIESEKDNQKEDQKQNSKNPYGLFSKEIKEISNNLEESKGINFRKNA